MHQKEKKTQKQRQQRQQMYTGLRQGLRLRDLQQALRGRKNGSEAASEPSE
jgi:hypothetical protein